MIKYGAQEIILAENDGMLEQNIDSIIDYSMQKTNEIKQELSKLEDKFNLNNVSLTGDDWDTQANTTLYTFEGHDYKRKQQTESDFIDIGQRERKQLSYDIDKYYREALNMPTVPVKEKKKLKGWRASANGGYDHQFFDNDRLDSLEEKEQAWNQYNENPEEWAKEQKPKPQAFTKKD